MKELLANNNYSVSETKQINYGDLINKFLNYIDVSDNTLETYKRCLKQFWIYIQENSISNPTREDILEWKEYLMQNNKPNTVNLYLVSVKNFFKWLEYEEITKDITKNIKSISVEKCFVKRGLTKEEITRLLNNCENLREKVLISLAITCSLRINEMSNITLDDFYNDNGIVMLKVLNKGGDNQKQGKVKIDDRIFALIKEYCKEYDIKNCLFTSNSNHNANGKVSNVTLRRWFKSICERANIDMNKISFHSLRHTGISLLVENGEDLYKVQQYSRHKNIQTVMTYVNEINLRDNKMTTYLGDIING